MITTMVMKYAGSRVVNFTISFTGPAKKNGFFVMTLVLVVGVAISWRQVNVSAQMKIGIVQ
jgi:hypothetical protein